MREERVVSITSEHEKNLLTKAADRVNESRSEFVRKAALERARSALRHRKEKTVSEAR